MLRGASQGIDVRPMFSNEQYARRSLKAAQLIDMTLISQHTMPHGSAAVLCLHKFNHNQEPDIILLGNCANDWSEEWDVV